MVSRKGGEIVVSRKGERVIGEQGRGELTVSRKGGEIVVNREGKSWW